MSIGDNTFWVVVPTSGPDQGVALTPENDKRYSLRFVTREAAWNYSMRLQGGFVIVEVRT